MIGAPEGQEYQIRVAEKESRASVTPGRRLDTVADVGRPDDVGDSRLKGRERGLDKQRAPKQTEEGCVCGGYDFGNAHWGIIPDTGAMRLKAGDE